MPDESLKGLKVYAGSGVHEVELSRGRHMLKPAKRVPLIADIDPQTGEVSFRIDPDRLDNVRQWRPAARAEAIITGRAGREHRRS